MIELLIKLKGYLNYVFEKGSLGFSLLEIILILFAFIIALMFRGLFAKYIVFKIKNFIRKTTNIVDDQLFNSLSPPLKFLPFILVFVSISFFVETNSNLSLILERLNRTFFTIFVFWLLHQSLMPLSKAFTKLEELLSKASVVWLTNSLKYLIIFLGIVAVLETWGIKIGPIIAGLGLFGVAVALGAQDLFKNLISGILIILEKRFLINDIIEVPGHAKGSVEHIGFRSTLIRQFDSTPISIPNYVFSDSSIINFSDRKHRRINWIIGLTYDTSVSQLKEICKNIEKNIKENDNFIVDQNYQLFIRVEKFSDSSIDILIYTFTKTNEWEDYLKIKEDLIYMIKNVVEQQNSSFAFPSQSVYIEKNYS
jgi:MscS family membrane protein